MLSSRLSPCYVRKSLHAGIEIFYMPAWTENHLLLQGNFPVDMRRYGVYAGWLSISLESRWIESSMDYPCIKTVVILK